MNVKELSTLFKHVNIEEDVTIKNQMLQIIQQYLKKTETHDDKEVVSEDVTPTVEKTETVIKEKVVEPQVAQVETEEVVVVPSAELEAVVETIQEELPLVEDEAVDEEKSPIKKNIIGVEDIEAALEVVEEPQAMEDQVVEQVKEEELSSEEPTDLTEEVITDDTENTQEESDSDEPKTYVESFSILAPTNDEQLERLKVEGGYIFREKRTFMLGLCVGNEWIALAKTQKFNEFPKEVQEHLKAGEFVSVEIKAVGEAVKKSRANFRDIEFCGFELLPTDHPVKIDVRNLIEHGIIPEDKKAELEQKSSEEKVEAVVEQAVVEPTTTESAPTAEKTIKHVFELGDDFADNFTINRKHILKTTFPLSIKDNQGILKFNHPTGLLEIGKCQTTLLNGEYTINFIDYTMDGKVINADIVIVSENLEENTVSEIAPTKEVEVVEEAPITSKRSELVRINAKDAPADFPNKNQLTVTLLPLAAQKLDRKALNKNDKPINFLVKDNKVFLTYDIFTIGEVNETLSVEAIPDMKLMARAAQINVEDTENATNIIYTIDQMVQTDKYMSEGENVAPISDYIPLTEENFVIVQQKRVKASLPKTPQEVLTPKDVQPGQVEKMTNPNGPVENLGESVEQLVPHKEVSESIKALQNKPYDAEIVSSVMESAKSALATMVAEASSKTKVNLDSPEKKETVVQGTLKEGVGELTETETVVNFVTNYPVNSWERSVGKRMTLKSEFAFVPEQETSKTITIVGKDGSIVAKGQAPVTAAMFLDGNHHTAELLGVESAVQLEKGFSVSLRLGKFEKVS